jgi:hypothetical protein
MTNHQPDCRKIDFSGFQGRLRKTPGSFCRAFMFSSQAAGIIIVRPFDRSWLGLVKTQSQLIPGCHPHVALRAIQLFQLKFILFLVFYF